jgi:hypothetical protein
LIERAYTLAEAMGIAVWCEDEAGPYQTVPYPGASWQPEGEPLRQPHEYFQEGTAKLITLFHPATGQLRVKGTSSTRNAILHPWLETELTAILAELPAPTESLPPETNRARWESWRVGLSRKVTLCADLPPLRLLLVMDNLTGHKSPDWLVWCFQRGILPLFTPLGGSWLNMAESIQRIIQRRALAGQYPQDVATIIAWLEATAAGWNTHPTPFVWGGKRQTRRQRARERRLYRLAGSGACSTRPVQRAQAAA